VNNKGQALVEFVLILPVFIMILFVIVDFGIIFNKKSTLENDSVDIIELIKNDTNLDEIERMYPETFIELENNGSYLNVKITRHTNVITPGLNRILGNPHEIEVERKIPNV